MDRYEKLKKFLLVLDQKHALRLIVLLAPGMLAAKLAMFAPPGSPFGSIGVAVLGAGMVVYFSWGFFKNKLLGETSANSVEIESPGDTVAVSAQVTPGEVHAGYMRDLVDMCNGDAGDAIQLIAIECQVRPSEDYLAAIEYAHRRKSLCVRTQSGN